MAITDWPIEERPREKLLARGAAALSDAELLAIFLRTGTQGLTAVDLARKLLQDLGGLRALLEADERVFCDQVGLGRAKYAQLQAVLEIAHRHLRERLERGQKIRGTKELKEYVCARLRHLRHEVFACIYLDSQHRLINFQELFKGTLDSATVYPREVVKETLRQNASSVIFVHNHPSGNAEPSDADKWITQRLVGALDLIDVPVLDHLIVGDRNVISFSELGLLFQVA